MVSKNNFDNSLFVKYKGKNYLRSTVDKIKVTRMIMKLFNDIDDLDFLHIINTQVEKFLKEAEKIKEIHQDSEKTVEIILDFIQNIFNNFDVKKFYNLTPNISYKEYLEKPIWEQILNNIFDWKLWNKNLNFIEKEYVKWWNCHHWSILIKKIFDSIKIPWVDCQIRRFPQWHSFIMLFYKENFWVFDIIEKDISSWLKELNSKWWFKNYEIINKINYDDNSSIMDFSDLDRFAKYTDKEHTKWVRLQIDRIKAEVNWDVLMLEITKDNWRQKNKYEITLNKKTWKYDKQDFIIKTIPRIKRALNIISKKLPDWYIKDN